MAARSLGSASVWLRERLILAGALLVTAIGAGTSSTLLATGAPWAPAVLFGLGFVGAVAVFLDQVADRYEKNVSVVLGEAQDDAVSDALIALLTLLDDSHRIAFQEGRPREVAIETLQSQLASAAASAPTASRVRASFYRLTSDPSGQRELRDPKSRGRVDEASTEWVEKDDPDHPIWQIMSGRDTDCRILSAPDPWPRIDWDAKPYKTVISAPVTAKAPAGDDVVFGMLSVNAPQVGDLTETDRLTVIAMARVMALVLAMKTGPRKLGK